jgi:hypothetical protein
VGLDAPEVAPSPSPVEEWRGVSLAAGEPLVVAVASAAGPSHVRVTLTDESTVFVRTARESTGFRSEPNHLGVEMSLGDTLDVRIPRDATRVEITGANGTLFLWSGGSADASTPVQPDGTYLIEVPSDAR